MYFENKKTVVEKDEEGFIQTKTVVSEKNVICTIEGSTNKQSNPDEVRIFDEGQKQIPIKVTSLESRKLEHTKSNPNIVE